MDSLFSGDRLASAITPEGHASDVQQSCSSAMHPGDDDLCSLYLVDALLEAANVLLEAAASPLGSPLRRQLLSSITDVTTLAG